MLPLLFPIAAILYICTFKVGNTDFWWHIKAGQVLRDTGWIATDPFAYTRIGEAYLATHGWLAQIILSQFWDIGGVWGVTILRMLLVTTAFMLPLGLYRNNRWITGAVAVLAAVRARPSLTDRPQLFTFLFFSLIVSLCFAYLGSDERKRKQILILIPLTLVVWSNLHGAASLVGVAVFALLIVQAAMNGAWNKWLALSFVGALIAPLITPTGVANITYLTTVLSNQSSGFIAEWQPAPWGTYLLHTAPLWIASVTSVLLVRRDWIFCAATLLMTGYLSRTAGRHEVLFLISALAVTVWQLSNFRIHGRVLLLAIFAFLAIFTHVRTYDINRIDHLFGIGLFEPMRGAYHFVERAEIEGNMFNNYNAGGELLFRGYPDRKVFLDGRNLDYGHDYINRAINAGVEPNVWQELEDEYQFTHAVIYYDLQAELNPLPYTDLLDQDPDWQLVYLDDWGAAYGRVDSGKWIVENAIRSITPKMLHRLEIPEELTVDQFNLLQNDLNRMIQERPDGVLPRIYIAKLYTMVGAYDEAEVLLNNALEEQSKNFRIYLGLMELYREQGKTLTAERMFTKAKWAAGFSGVQIK